MPESVPARGRAAPQRGPARESHRAAAPSLRVRYWKRMRLSKVYPVVVSWQGSGGGDPVTVRLVVAGAQVVPAEQTMYPNNPRETATFYVTPLAKGWLRGERLEVIQDGQKVQEIRTPAKVNNQRATWFLLFLTFFLPWLILHYLVYSPIGYTPPAYVPPGGTAKPPKDFKPEEAAITKPLKENLPNYEDLKPSPYKEEDFSIYKLLNDVVDWPGAFNRWLYIAYQETNQPIAFYVFVGLLVLTFLSWFIKQEKRGTRYGKPLPTGGGV